MSGTGNKASYAAVVSVIVVWVGISSFAKLGEDLIPEESSPANQIISRDEFIRQGAQLRVRWHPFSSETLKEAKRLDRPIFLLVGSSWNKFGRRMDQTFKVPRVAERLNRDFICSRIDEVADPFWRSALIPGTRAMRNGIDGYAGYVLSGDGDLVALFDSTDDALIQDRLFLSFLHDAVLSYGNRSTRYSSVQSDRLFLLKGGSVSTPISVTEYLRSSQLVAEKTAMQFEQGGKARHWAQEWLLSEEVGFWNSEISSRVADSAKSIDWVHGGFFLESLDENWDVTVFSKCLPQTAELLELKALQTQRTGNQIDRLCAVRTFDYLEKILDEESVPFYSYAETGAYDRSSTHSLSVRQFKSVLTPEQQEKAKDILGLEVRKNEQMLPFISHSSTALMTDFAQILGEIRESRTKEMEVGGFGYSYGESAAVAGMLKAAFFMNESWMINIAIQRFESLKNKYRIGPDDVFSQPYGGSKIQGSLLDYVHYSDCAWSMYALTGMRVYWDEGVSVLQRGLLLYSNNDGLPMLNPKADLPEIIDKLKGVEMIDGYQRSTSGLVVELLALYSATCEDNSLRGELEQKLEVILNGLSAYVRTQPYGCGGFVRGAVQANAGAILLVHPTLLNEVNGWQRPFRVVRSELPGIRLMGKGTVSESMSLKEAQEHVKELISEHGLRFGY